MLLKNRTILVTGGTGFIGGHLVEKIINEYDEANVRVLVRDFSRASRLGRFNLQFIAGNITDPVVVDSAVKGCDLIFHCAYDFVGDRKQSKKINVSGIENIAQASLKHKARLVHVSTIDVYGWPDLDEITENTPRRAKGNIYAETKLAVENVVKYFSRRYGLPVTILQPTIVYGPFSGAWTINVISQLKSFKIALPNEGKGICNLVYIDDLIDAMVLAATVDDAIGETILISGEQSISWQEFYGAYEKLLGLESTINLSEDIITDYKKNRNEFRQLIAKLKDPEVHTALSQLPVVGKLYSPLYLLPQDILEKLKVILLNPFQAQKEVHGRPIHVPNPWTTRIYQSNARVCIDKAKQLLGYQPRIEFDEGMDLTAKYLKWANVV